MDDEIIYSWCFNDVKCFDSTPSAAIIILDRDLESFSSLISQHLHQTSSPHTSQQNGVVERKHHHFLDMTRTLLYEMGVPHEFWTNAILTSAFLTNRLPSTLLGGKVPLRCLHLDREIFSLPPHVFGSVAFAQEHSNNKSKLASRVVRGLLVPLNSIISQEQDKNETAPIKDIKLC